MLDPILGRQCPLHHLSVFLNGLTAMEVRQRRMVARRDDMEKGDRFKPLQSGLTSTRRGAMAAPPSPRRAAAP